MKFRVARSTFRREELVERLALKPLNDMPELPLYGREPRVRCKNLRGPWQEVELRVHDYDEIDRPEFAPQQPSLEGMTRKAIELLSPDPDGFFLLVEGSQVDWPATPMTRPTCSATC